MAKISVKVTFETITPLWTGDAWGECKEIRPSSLLGSLRFWFETIMYFAGVLNKADYNKELGRFEKEVKEKAFKNCLKEQIKNLNNNFTSKIKCLKNQGIPISSIVFGTTNRKGLIEIKEIKPLKDYCFGNRLNLPYAIGIKKDTLEIIDFETDADWKNKINEYKGRNFKEKLNSAKQEYSFFFFFHPYFYGSFQVTFLVEKGILEPIFFPLLNFMDNYGFWGGKWNIGYGRLRVKEIKRETNWRKSDFKLFDGINFNFNDLLSVVNVNSNNTHEYIKAILNVDSFDCKTEIDFENKTKRGNIPKKLIKININLNNGVDYKDLIKKLLGEKIKIRNCLRHECEEKIKECYEKENGRAFKENKEIECKSSGKMTCKQLIESINLWKKFRHELLGEQGEGSKILPFIWKENDQLKGGFLSIAGLLTLEGGQNE